MAKSSAKAHDRAYSARPPGRGVLAAFSLLVSMALLAGSARGEADTVRIPSATPLSIELVKHAPMKVGEALQGRLLYPVYVNNRMALPVGTLMRGVVIHLGPDRSRRIRARLRGDFTPYHVPIVRFDQWVASDGMLRSMRSDEGSNGVPLLRLSPPPGSKNRSFLARQVIDQKQRLQADAALFTAPGKTDRLVQFLYKQLPYHPERIETDTAWMVELAQPMDVDLPAPGKSSPGSVDGEKKTATRPATVSTTLKEREEWQIHAYLQQSISSSREKPGNQFEALVAEPVFNADHSLAVPEGSTLIGEITQAKPARSFGRSGRLRFHFRELRLPAGFTQPVEGTLNGIDAGKSAGLTMDPEGGLQPQSQNRAIAPLLLGILAGRAFDDDGNKALNNGVASNGFGIAGRLVGILANSRNVAAGIGFYAAALSIYDLWLAHGHDVSFVKNTRIEVATTPGRSPLGVSGTKRKAAGSP